MKKTLIATALAFGMLSLAQAAPLSFPDVAATKAAAKEQNMPALVIWHGSDWLPGAGNLCAEWNKLSAAGLPVILGQYDDCLGQEGGVRSKMLPIECYNLPTAVLLAPDGSYMASFSPDIAKNAAALTAAVKPLVAVEKKFSALLQEARSSQGVAAATAAGKALDLLPLGSAMRQRELTSIINKQDPADETGYRSVYCLEHMGMFREINLLLKGGADGDLKNAARDFAAAEAYVRKTLANKRLKGERRQQWLAGLYYVQKEKMLSGKSSDRSEILATLKKIIDISPKTLTGRGAVKYYDYWNPDNFYTIANHYYEGGDMTFRFEKEWHVDVTSDLSGAGEYTFSLVPSFNGAMISRDYRLVVNGREVAKAKDADADKNTKTVTFDVPAVPPGSKVEVYLRTQCNDGWLGCSGRIEMKKK